MPKLNLHCYLSIHSCRWLHFSINQSPCPSLRALPSAIPFLFPTLCWVLIITLNVLFPELLFWFGGGWEEKRRNGKSGMPEGKKYSQLQLDSSWCYTLNQSQYFSIWQKKMLRICFYFTVYFSNTNFVECNVIFNVLNKIVMDSLI